VNIRNLQLQPYILSVIDLTIHSYHSVLVLILTILYLFRNEHNEQHQITIKHPESLQWTQLVNQFRYPLVIFFLKTTRGCDAALTAGVVKIISFLLVLVYHDQNYDIFFVTGGFNCCITRQIRLFPDEYFSISSLYKNEKRSCFQS